MKNKENRIHISSIELKFIQFCHINILVLAGVVLFLISLIIRWHFRGFISRDYEAFLLPWYNELIEGGGYKALKNEIGDYYIPYITLMATMTYLPGPPLYWIKLVSIVFDYIAAGVSGMIVWELKKDYCIEKRKLLVFLTWTSIILSPMVISNGAVWGQCDIIYTTFILLSLYFMIKMQYTCSFLFLGIAFCFKFQTVFMLPIYILLYLKQKRFSILYFMYIPLMYLVSGLPAIFAGRRILNVYGIYFGQITSYNMLTLKMPNIYSLLPEQYGMFFLPGIMITMALIILMAVYVVYYKVCVLDKLSIILLACWFNMTYIFFFPAMHERYSFLFIILSGLIYIQNYRKVYIPIIFNAVAVITYNLFLFGFLAIDMRILAIIHLALWLVVSCDIVKYLNQEGTVDEKAISC